MKNFFKKFKKPFLIALALVFFFLALWQLGVFGKKADLSGDQSPQAEGEISFDYSR